MISILLNENLVFHERDPYAEPLFVDKTSRILRFALKPGQSVREHMAPHSPVTIVVLKGSGLFSGGENQEQRVGPGTLLVFDAREIHANVAEVQGVVVVVFLEYPTGAQ